MDKYRKYFGVIVFAIAVSIVATFALLLLSNQYNTWQSLKEQITTVSQELEQQKNLQRTVQMKIKKLKESVMNSQKKIYTPVEDFGNDKNDTLFFTLYNDVIEMVKANIPVPILHKNK